MVTATKPEITDRDVEIAMREFHWALVASNKAGNTPDIGWRKAIRAALESYTPIEKRSS